MLDSPIPEELAPGKRNWLRTCLPQNSQRNWLQASPTPGVGSPRLPRIMQRTTSLNEVNLSNLYNKRGASVCLSTTKVFLPFGVPVSKKSLATKVCPVSWCPKGLSTEACPCSSVLQVLHEGVKQPFGCKRSEPSRQDRASRSDSAAERGPTACLTRM